VVHTTGSPRTVETIAVRAAPHDIDVVDSPVSGGPHNAAARALTAFVGGAEEAVARVRPVLSCYRDPVLHVGPLGDGPKVKLVNNALFAAQSGCSPAPSTWVRVSACRNRHCSPPLPHGGHSAFAENAGSNLRDLMEQLNEAADMYEPQRAAAMVYYADKMKSDFENRYESSISRSVDDVRAARLGES
jgi:NAD binding domain of 6-phosphogluconate dehydrogenase